VLCPNCNEYDFSISEKLRMIYGWQSCPTCGMDVRLSRVGFAIFSGLSYPIGLVLLLLSSKSIVGFLFALAAIFIILEAAHAKFSSIVARAPKRRSGSGLL
jgi:hypothetical protein